MPSSAWGRGTGTGEGGGLLFLEKTRPGLGRALVGVHMQRKCLTDLLHSAGDDFGGLSLWDIVVEFGHVCSTFSDQTHRVSSPTVGSFPLLEPSSWGGVMQTRAVQRRACRTWCGGLQGS